MSNSELPTVVAVLGSQWLAGSPWRAERAPHGLSLFHSIVFRNTGVDLMQVPAGDLL